MLFSSHQTVDHIFMSKEDPSMSKASYFDLQLDTDRVYEDETELQKEIDRQSGSTSDHQSDRFMPIGNENQRHDLEIESTCDEFTLELESSDIITQSAQEIKQAASDFNLKKRRPIPVEGELLALTTQSTEIKNDTFILWEEFLLNEKKEQDDGYKSKSKVQNKSSIRSRIFHSISQLSVDKLEIDLCTRIERRFLASVFCYLFDADIDSFQLESTQNFIDTLQSLLQSHSEKQKRNDERLRWFFKRFIRSLLSEHTCYEPTKKFKMENHIGTLVSIYFPQNPEVYEDVCNLKFASKKKLVQLFMKSSTFKEKAMNFLSKSLIQQHEVEVRDYIKRLHDLFSENSDQHDLKKLYRMDRVPNPWLPSEVRRVYEQVKEVYVHLS